MLHHDLGLWGFVVAVVALVLTFPLSLAANLMTPRIRKWWDERSLAALREGIARRENELLQISKYELFSVGEDYAVRVGLFCGSLVSMVLSILGLGLGLLPAALPMKAGRKLATELLAGSIFLLVISAQVLLRIWGRHYRDHSPRERLTMTEHLEALKGDLASRTPETEPSEVVR